MTGVQTCALPICAYAKGLSDAFGIVEEVLEMKAENWKLLETIRARFQKELGLTDE